jgi:hypothetical protein
MPIGNARSGSVCEIVIRSRRRRRPPTDATTAGGCSRDRPGGIVIRSRRSLSSTGRAVKGGSEGDRRRAVEVTGKQRQDAAGISRCMDD